MPRRISKYQTLKHIKELGLYVDKNMRPVNGLQDPYNPLSYNVYYTNICKAPKQQSYPLVENYNNKKEEDEYILIEYKNNNL